MAENPIQTFLVPRYQILPTLKVGICPNSDLEGRSEFERGTELTSDSDLRGDDSDLRKD